MASAIVAGALTCLGGASAAIASVRFGADLTQPTTGLGVACSTGQTCTFFTSAPPTAGGQITSPVTGTVIRFLIGTHSSPPPPPPVAPTITFRVIASPTPGLFTGGGTSTAVPTPTATAVTAFPAQVPIQAGSRLGVDFAGGGATTALFALATPAGAKLALFSPALADGSAPASGTMVGTGLALQIAADVAALPGSTATIPACASGPIAGSVTTDPDPAVAPKAMHFRVDGGSEQTAAATGNPGLAGMTVPDGTHSLEYWGADNVGGQESPHHTTAVHVDTVKPTVTISSDQGKVGYSLGEPASISVAASDAGSNLTSNPSTARETIPTAVPGTFTVTRTATDACGNTGSGSFTYTVVAAGTGTGGGGPVGAAAISGLGVQPRSFAPAKSGASIARRRPKTGTAISYNDSQAATTTFTVQRAARGVRKGKRCAKPSRRKRGGKRCTRIVSVGSFTHPDAAGANRFGFTGRVRGRALRPGSYRLQSVARGADGTPSPPATASFRIVRG